MNNHLWHEIHVWDGSASQDLDTDFHVWATFQTVGTGTVTMQATVDGTNWSAVEVTNLSDGTTTTGPTAAGIYRCNCAGFRKMRANSPTGFTSIHGRATNE